MVARVYFIDRDGTDGEEAKQNDVYLCKRVQWYAPPERNDSLVIAYAMRLQRDLSGGNFLWLSGGTVVRFYGKTRSAQTLLVPALPNPRSDSTNLGASCYLCFFI